MNQPDLVPVYRIFGLGRRDQEHLTGFCDFLEAGASSESPKVKLIYFMAVLRSGPNGVVAPTPNVIR